jgi:DNA-directed RNA polymerase III subunit RPC3
MVRMQFISGVNLSPTPFRRFVDLDKAYSNLLRNLYKTLYNISRRRRAEEDEPTLKVVLEKRERTDVSVDESLLTRMERETLAEWQARREKLTVLEMRVEEAVFVLKDLAVLEQNDD